MVLAVLSAYGGRSLSRRGPDSPAEAARAAVQADNTVVGLLGGVQGFQPLGSETGVGAGTETRVEARVVGGRDSGRMSADLDLVDGRWTVLRATFTLSDGTSIPVAGSAGR